MLTASPFRNACTSVVTFQLSNALFTMPVDVVLATAPKSPPGFTHAVPAWRLFQVTAASLQLVPTTVIALRAAAHSTDPAGILLPTLMATVCALTVGILAARLLERVWK